MAMSMGPPILPGFSLRVQLFSPNAHALNDKPLRCFRVVTSPDATVREFCEEASRIHKINYGEPIAIKKCQDELEFDITQNEILGTLFANTATIRVIQATATPGVRDSVPPTSALRYDPAHHPDRKREREEKAGPNGSPLSIIRRPNKRQRVSVLDPDLPLPSRETDLTVGGTIDEEEEPRDEMIPDSQREAAYKRDNGNSGHAREDPRISETPSPHLELPHLAPFENSSAYRQGRKSNIPDTDDHLMSQMSIPSPFGPASLQARNAARSKSASYHIQRSTERGTSVSTAATSPLSGDQQGAATNGTKTSNKRKTSDPTLEALKTNGVPLSRSPNGDSIYENVPSDSERSSVLKRTKEKLKPKNGSPSGLYGLDWSTKFNTPPSGSRRTSCSQDRVISNGELPLTPNSKEREERQRQKEHSSEATRARIAAAEAAEQRKWDASDARATEEQKKKRRKQNDIIATAVRLEKERVEQMEQDQNTSEQREAENNRQERRRLREEAELAELERERQATIARERQERERLDCEEQARIQRELEAARLEREKARAEQVDREQEEEARRRAKETALAMESTRKSRAPSEQSKGSTPDRSKATPIRPQLSSTAFFPSGRKSALKNPSSQAVGSSSPVLARTISAGSSNGSRTDLPPGESKRRVSFLEENLKDSLMEDQNKTPASTPKEISKPTPLRTPILPPLRASASKSALKPTIKPPTGSLLKQSTTPILPPSSKRSSKGESTTALVQSTGAPPRLGATTKPVVVVTKVPPPVTKSVSPAVRQPSQNRQTSHDSVKSKAPTMSASPSPVQPATSTKESDKGTEDKKHEDDDEEDEDEDEADEEEDESEAETNEDDEDMDGPSRINPVEALNSSVRSPAKPKVERESEPASQDEEKEEGEEDVEMQDIQSNRSSSRSPILFNSRATPGKVESATIAESASSVSDTSNDEEESEDEDKSASEDDASDDEEDVEDKTITAPAPRPSPPSLPPTHSTIGISERKSSQRKNLTISPGSSTGDESYSTQDEVDFQLTSSMFEASPAAKSTPIPIPSSSVTRPKFAIGASLSDMNAKKPTVGSSASKANSTARALKLIETDEEESDEESEDESDSGSDDEQILSQTLAPKSNLPQPSDSDNSDSDTSDSDSESGSGNESEDDMRAHQNDLAEQINKMASASQGSTQSYDIPSSKPMNAQSSRSSSAVMEKEKIAKSGKADKRFNFSKPKWM